MFYYKESKMPVSIFLIISLLVMCLFGGAISWMINAAEDERELQEIRDRLNRLGGSNVER